MAQTAAEFFGSLGEVPAQTSEGPKAAVKAQSAESFFGDMASQEETPTTPATVKEEESLFTRGRRYEAAARQKVVDWYSASPAIGAAELLGSAVTGIVGGAEGLARGAGALMQGEGLDAAANVARDTLSARTYRPQSASAQMVGQGFGALEENVFRPMAAPIEAAIGPTATNALSGFGEPLLAAAPGASFLRSIPAGARAAMQARGGPLALSESPMAPMRAAAPLEAQAAPRGTPFTALERPEPPIPPAPKVAEKALALEAKGEARKAPYTELEGGEKPPKFVEETPTAEGGKVLDEPNQLRRAEILDRIGLEQPRRSAITGDPKAAATDFQTSKLDTPGGNYLTETFNNERAALNRYSARIIMDTGGTPGLGQTEMLQRGQNMLAPLDDLKAHFDNGIKALYRAADERAQGVPMKLLETKKLMGSQKSYFTGTTDGQALYDGTVGRMQELGIIDNSGRLGDITVQQAEQLKQYLNEQWSPKTSRLIRRMKDSIDDDVTTAAGEDIYKSSRALRALRGRVLDDPNGIAKIMDAEGPENINRKVPIEKIADTLTTLPVAQFKHIVKTLQEVPEEILPQASAALAEIKAQYANKVHEIGSRHATQWNAEGVSQYLNANSARMNVIFTPDEMQQFATLNDAGHILRFPASYPGAAVQARNISLTGIDAIENLATTAGAAAGSIFGPLTGAAGAVVGRKAGSAVTGAINRRSSMKNAQARTVKIAELLNKGKDKK